MIVTITAGLLSKSAGKVLEKILDQLLDLDEVDSILIPEQYRALVVPKYAALPVGFSTDDFAGQIKQCVEGASAKAQSRNMPVLCLNADFLLDMDVMSAWKRRNLVFCCAASFTEGCAFATHRVGGITCREGMGNVVTEVLLDAAAPLQMCGVIGFEVLEDVYEYIELQKPASTAAECVAGMMRDGVTFQAQIIPRAASFCLATETLCQEYELGFLFDLDGTLVQTDDIYTSVWNGLLRQYGLAVDHAFFDHFIRGKSDFAFLRFLMPSISEAEVRDMSVKKDEEFILALSAEQEDVVNVGAREFMERVSNSRVAVVTSCNKSAAEYILKKTGLGEYCSLIISADDCVKHKPHPEPYLRAMKLLGLGPESCVAFEDSLSGYWSAKHSRPRRVCVFTGLKAGCR
jgi:HAD superfamily hydrolase (TIGR01509 family)